MQSCFSYISHVGQFLRHIFRPTAAKDLTPHVDACLPYYKGELLCEGPDAEERAHIAFKFAWAYAESSRFEKALELQFGVLKMLPADHRNKLFIMAHVANNLLSIGRYDEAMEIYTALLKELTDGDDHGAMVAMVGMGAVFLGRREDQKAVEICAEAMEKFQGSFETGHYHMLMALSIIAFVDQRKGRLKEAVKSHEKVRSIQETSLDVPHSLADCEKLFST
jgi:tetratricopeptide (TPR) repeat protein